MPLLGALVCSRGRAWAGGCRADRYWLKNRYKRRGTLQEIEEFAEIVFEKAWRKGWTIKETITIA